MREGHLGLRSPKGVARLAIAGIVGAAVAVTTSTAIAASGWALAPSPNLGSSSNVLSDVACTSSTSCMAVGYYYAAGFVPQTLTERWDGTAWSVIASPNGTGGSQLDAVACTSSTNCTAVGHSGSSSFQTLVESWNGTAWSIITSPNDGTQNSELNGVACASATSCVAVGEYEGSLYFETLVESWNGTAWAIIPSPNQATSQFNTLYGVTCTGASNCMAVGYYYNGSVDQTLIESWNGTVWSILSSPNNGAGQNDLNAVACTSSAKCVAVGASRVGSAFKTLVESWNGTSWSIVTSPNAGTGSTLEGVSCTSSSSCVAVGYSNGSGIAVQTLAETWNGTIWTVVASLNPGTASDDLYSVACTSSINCTAVGSYYNGSGGNQTLAETWNGTAWTVAVSSDQGGSNNSLNGVSCTSSTGCIAVGGYFNGAVQQTLVERWNGSTWTVMASPNQGSSNNSLAGIACSTSTSCFAVGTYAKSGVEQTLIENWNGTTWTIATSPNSGAGSNILSGVACTSSSSCVAVGYYFNASALAQTLVESWNGSVWTISTSANHPNITNSLSGVSCTASTACTAVGGSVNGASIAQTLIERWNGSAWTISASPNPGTIDNELNGVTCTSANGCTAVGDYFNSSNVDQTLVEQWNGTTWATIASPDSGTMRNALEGIACTSATSCVGVGLYYNSGSTYQTLAESWNGSAWSIVASANQASGSNLLSGVACTSSTTCTAVGAFTTGGTSQTLVETGPGASVTTSITVTSPLTGASWARGSSHAITWTSSGSPGTHVKIQLLKSGTLVKTITTSVLTSAGTFAWKVPTTLSPAATYQIKIVSTTNSKVFGTSGHFSIT